MKDWQGYQSTEQPTEGDVTKGTFEHIISAKLASEQRSKRALAASIVLGALLVAAAIAFAVVWVDRDKGSACTSPNGNNNNKHNKLYKNNKHTTTTNNNNNDDDNDDDDNNKNAAAEKIKSAHGKYHYAAVASESKTCSDIGFDILARHRGHAVDAMVATLLCNGVEHPQSSGIGGGALFVIYDKDKGFATANAREMAPMASSENMFVNNMNESRIGGKAVGVPGEILGLVEVHQRYGKVPWNLLVQPSIKLCKEGWILTAPVYEQVVALQNETGFEDFFDDSGNPLPVGSLIKNPRLAKTLEIIAEDRWSFYNGTLAKDIAKDVQERGGIITEKDMKQFYVAWSIPTKMELPGDLSIYSMPPPGSGPVLSYILSILAGYDFNENSVSDLEETTLTYHRIVEAMKFAYGKRSYLGDSQFVDVVDLVENLTSREFGKETRLMITDTKTQPLKYYHSDFYSPETHGTNHLSVVDAEGNAVAVTSTINLYFGSTVVGKRTGIVFNNEMDDFSTPGLINAFGILPSKSNFIKPGKRPMSSMAPSIIFDDETQKVKMVVGAAGGSRITSTTALLIMDFLWFNMSMADAMDLPRFHHQLLPNTLVVEPDFPQDLRDALGKKGHIIEERETMSVAHGIGMRDGFIEAASDYRKGGAPSGY